MTGPILHVFTFDREGRGRLVETADAEISGEGAAFDWIHVDAIAPDARACLTKRLGLEDWMADGLLAEDTRPHCDIYDEAASVNLRGINHNPGDEPEDMLSLRMWVAPNRIVTARRRYIHALEDVRAALREGRARARTPGGLVALIAARLADRMTPTIIELNDKIDAFEEQVVDDVSEISRSDLAQLRRTAILIRRFVAPQREALNRLTLEDMPWSTEEDRRRFREAADMTTRIAEEIDAARERAAIVQEHVADARAQALNHSMLILSVAAVIFLPLNLIAGMFGMNVGGVPLAHTALGFWVMTAVLVAIGAFGGWLFKRIGWW